MEVHEFQAKEILASHGVPLGRRAVATTAMEIGRALDALGRNLAGYVVKAQVHSGGRSRGHFTDGSPGGGVRRVATADEAEIVAQAMLGQRLVTAQSGPHGKPITAILFEEVVATDREFYLAIFLDRREQLPVLLASDRGGVAVEGAAQKHGILREKLWPTVGPCPFQLRRTAFSLGLESKETEFCGLVAGMWRIFWEKNATLVEINPLALAEQGNFYALDAKISFDDSGLTRHADIRALRDPSQEDGAEIQAGDLGLSYVTLGGTVACLTNGAGLAMATMDLLHAAGVRPVNFLDLGDGAELATVAQAFRLLLAEDGANCLLINVFGGSMRGDLVAAALLLALAGKQPPFPLLVRLEGPAAADGRSMLRDHISDVKILPDLLAVEEAVRQIC
ncbi:MAG: succinate--CoA ligase subunit beta [Puniceicoccales bacterium]|jgi:succinyl-CoA synthetase beta subunit|nr:succinate--CoA ligase subunit beta [Puniceicoccales bacterium]